jgi:fatty-acyl-CoA synthase
VFFTHRQLVLHCLTVLATVSQAAENGRFSRNDVYMPLTPMFHAHAWGYPYIATLCGWKQVYPGRYEPSLLFKLVKDEGVTFSHCVPTVLNMVLSAPEARDADFGGWKVLIGGSALSRALCKTALAHNIDVYSGYGMSESCPLLTLAQIKTDAVEGLEQREEREIDVRLTAGMPILLAQVRVVDADMNSVPDDGSSVGEVVVRAPYLTQGYLKSPQASDTLWKGGWMHTADIARFDADGYLHLVDRQKDVIKSGGEWISSVDLENAIMGHPQVLEAAVIGVPDPKWEERPCAYVVPKPEFKDTLTKADILSFLETRVAKWWLPDEVIFIDAVPKTSVGKFDKKVLRQLHAAAAESAV